jgi:hypothetical protein
LGRSHHRPCHGSIISRNLVRADQNGGESVQARTDGGGVRACPGSAAGINDYSYDVSVNLPFCRFEATLEFEHGQLASVEEPEFVDIFCGQDLAYENLLVPAMYSRVSKEMDEIDPLETSLKVEFNPDLGFVSFYRRQCDYRTGGTGDCIYEYRFSNFTTSGGNGAE